MMATGNSDVFGDTDGVTGWPWSGIVYLLSTNHDFDVVGSVVGASSKRTQKK